MDKSRILSAALMVVAVSALAVGLASLRTSAPAPTRTLTPTEAPTQAGDPEENPALTQESMPADKLYITVARQHYRSGDLTLMIPKLSLEEKVYAGTGAAVLLKGVGLYDYSQLPEEENANVSLAGHRNGRSNGVVNDHAPFYYIDTLGEGDYLYLKDGEHTYRYVYESTEIVEADDWSPIFNRGYPCLTITSCDPIGTSERRIVVRAKFEESAEPPGAAG